MAYYAGEGLSGTNFSSKQAGFDGQEAVVEASDYGNVPVWLDVALCRVPSLLQMLHFHSM